jgi:DNA (cytosine-5)-methyltransferase 1
MNNWTNTNEHTFSGISFFSGAMGLDLGLEAAGFNIRLCVEIDKACQNTIRENTSKIGKKDMPVLGDITKLSYKEILMASGLPKGEEVTLLAGGPPCQAFSTAGKRGSINDPRGMLVTKYLELINEIRPRFFVFENVRGILSAALQHRPLNMRGPGHPSLAPEEELGSLLKLVIIPGFEKIGYEVKYDLVDVADYGVPQNRKRVLFIGSRDHDFSKLGLNELREIIPPTHSKDGKNSLMRWRTLGDAIKDLDQFRPEFQGYSKNRAAIFEKVPPGKNWRYLRDTYGDEYLRQVMGGAYNSGGGKVGFWRRLSYEKPSPTLTTSPLQKSTALCHPEQTRPLSVREYARIQDFPDFWEFTGSTSQKYQQIGNAVPVGMGEAIGKGLMEVIRRTEILKKGINEEVAVL